MQTASKLALLRETFPLHALEAYLIPHADLYQNEFLPPCAQRLSWLTGFDGSAGLAVVTLERAALFVDGRYTLQAQEQVDTTLFDIETLDTATVGQWLGHALSAQEGQGKEKGKKEGGTVGLDPWLYTRRGYERLLQHLRPQGIQVCLVSQNLIDHIWQDRPLAPCEPLTLYPESYAGRSLQDKCAELVKHLDQKGADYALVTQPESLCWLLNMRGQDVPFTPLALCLGRVHSSGHLDLFIEERKVPSLVRDALEPSVHFHPFETFENTLRTMAQDDVTVLLDPDSVPEQCCQILEEGRARLLYALDPCLWPKACKTKTEVQGAQKAHLKDGVALTKFLFWIDTTLGHEDITELSAAEKLLSFRQEQAAFQGPSFETISGAGPHGALVHYRVTPNTNSLLKKGDLYLVDSGGQYLEGTTDVTRTIALGGTSSSLQKEAFTRVLKGHIALASTPFPEGTCGYQLDALARQYLWQAGYDYAHGTGHGVGTYLSVHEGPQGISMVPKRLPLAPGMILSNEPGYYLEGAFGIRLESLVVVEKKTAFKASFLGFRTLTLAPIDQSLIDASLLTPQEIRWLNDYHKDVYETLSPFLDPPFDAWLLEKTALLRVES